MSTILQALQKSKLDQAGKPSPVVQPQNRLLNWKSGIFFLLFIIIALLTALIYLLLPLRNEQQNPTIATSKIIQPLQSSNQPVKIIFNTKRLPSLPPKVIKMAAVKIVASPKIVAPAKIITPPEKVVPQKTIATGESKQDQLDENENEDVQPSSELKKRFELALLLSDIEQNDELEDESSSEEEMNNASDIHQMSSAFQEKVPLIRYDSHMYSSVHADRWIRINGETLKEGEFDSSGQLELLEIQPQSSIFRLGRQSFTLESLVDWKGY